MGSHRFPQQISTYGDEDKKSSESPVVATTMQLQDSHTILSSTHDLRRFEDHGVVLKQNGNDGQLVQRS
jgi:hypothetical protein